MKRQKRRMLGAVCSWSHWRKLVGKQSPAASHTSASLPCLPDKQEEGLPPLRLQALLHHSRGCRRVANVEHGIGIALGAWPPLQQSRWQQDWQL